MNWNMKLFTVVASSLLSFLLSTGSLAEFKLDQGHVLTCAGNLKGLRGTLSPFLLDETFTQSNATLTSASFTVILSPSTKSTGYRKFLTVYTIAKYKNLATKIVQINLAPGVIATDRILIKEDDSKIRLQASSKTFGDFISLTVPNQVTEQNSVGHGTLSLRQLNSDKKISVVDLRCQIAPTTL